MHNKLPSEHLLVRSVYQLHTTNSLSQQACGCCGKHKLEHSQCVMTIGWKAEPTSLMQFLCSLPAAVPCRQYASFADEPLLWQPISQPLPQQLSLELAAVI